MISFQLGFLDPFILIPDGKAAEEMFSWPLQGTKSRVWYSYLAISLESKKKLIIWLKQKDHDQGAYL